MKIHYTGRKADISDAQKRKLEAKSNKIEKVLGRKHSSAEAHVILSRQRHLFEAEVTLRALHHTLVVTASRPDAYSALLAAFDKLEKQAVKNKHKLIDGRRPERQRGEPSPVTVAVANAAAEAAEIPGNSSAGAQQPQIVRSSEVAPKPLTVEEALIQLDEHNRDQLTYRDAESGKLHVLLRRRDGNFELIEAS